MTQQHNQNSFQTHDGLKIHTEAWIPNHEIKAVILLVHGIGEHIGRYQHVAQYLTERGYAVYGLDHRAHGQSEGQPRVYITDFALVVQDLKQYFDHIRAEQPNKLIFLYGHSLGSFISSLFALHYQDELAGFISSGSPLLVDSLFSPLLVPIGNILSRFVPKLPLIPLELKTISHDPVVVSAYMSDPLVYSDPVPIGVAVSYNRAVGRLRNQLSELHLPLLILHGEDDRTVPASGSQLLYNHSSSSDKTIKIYPGLYHEIHNEPEKDVVLADIASWLDAHVKI